MDGTSTRNAKSPKAESHIQSALTCVTNLMKTAPRPPAEPSDYEVWAHAFCTAV
ncbi:hypothetical protein EVJ58_g10966, partial [Rhodofomes roseus]